MYNGFVLKAMQVFNEIQMSVAVIFGMFIQFFLGENKTWRVAFTIIISSIFVAMYITAPLIEILGIDVGSKKAIALYAISSLISTEMIVILIVITPKAFRQRLVKFLGIKDDSNR